MLTLYIPGQEFWDSKHEIFVTTKPTTLTLEHSLLSLSKWEAKWCTPFLSSNNLSNEQLLDYIRCMVINPKDPDANLFLSLSNEMIEEINSYINKPMTATVFSDKNQKQSRQREKITSELIYYWMITFNIPFECEKWHLNRLLTLIRLCSIKNTPPKKMSKGEIYNRNQALNAARRAKLHSKG